MRQLEPSTWVYSLGRQQTVTKCDTGGYRYCGNDTTIRRIKHVHTHTIGNTLLPVRWETLRKGGFEEFELSSCKLVLSSAPYYKHLKFRFYANAYSRNCNLEPSAKLWYGVEKNVIYGVTSFNGEFIQQCF